MDGRKLAERELKKARTELFSATNLTQIKFIQKKIAYLQTKIRGVG